MKLGKLKNILSREEKRTKNFLKRKILKCLRLRCWEYKVNRLDTMFILSNREIDTSGMSVEDLASLLDEIWRW